MANDPDFRRLIDARNEVKRHGNSPVHLKPSFSLETIPVKKNGSGPKANEKDLVPPRRAAAFYQV
jgi:hypothetical protein